MTALTAIVLDHHLASREAVCRRDFCDVRDFGDILQVL